MSVTRILLAVSIGAFAMGSVQQYAHAANYPFVGRWNCEVSEFTFTNRTFNNGSETLLIVKVEEGKNDFKLTFKNDYAIALLNVTPKTMTWQSFASGDTFKCKRL